MKNKIKYIAFDADDTLWDNELFFNEFEKKFCSLVEGYLPDHRASGELFNTQMANLHLYGYGAKCVMLCMIELVCRIVDADDSKNYTAEIIGWGKELLQKPVQLLDGVEEVLDVLGKKYKLVLATKGDLLDQERKIEKSGLKEYFTHIEIMSGKKSEDYRNMLDMLNLKPENFLMVGNSVKSDIIPVLELGASAAYVPYHITWRHEQHNDEVEHPDLIKLNKITELLNFL